MRKTPARIERTRVFFMFCCANCWLPQPALRGVEAGDVDELELALERRHGSEGEVGGRHRGVARVADDDDLEAVPQEALVEAVAAQGDIDRQNQVPHAGQRAADVESQWGADSVRRIDQRSEDDHARRVELLLPFTHLLHRDVVQDGVVVDPSPDRDLPCPGDRILAHEMGSAAVVVGRDPGDVVLTDDLEDLLGGQHHAAAGEPEASLGVHALVDAAHRPVLKVLVESRLNVGDCREELLRADCTEVVDVPVLVVPGLQVQVPCGRSLHRISILLKGGIFWPGWQEVFVLNIFKTNTRCHTTGMGYTVVVS